MKTVLHRSALFLVSLMWGVGCDSTFNPDGVYEEKMVVYGVLSSRSDTQYVRVYTTYPNRGGPIAQGIHDAQVTITGGNNSFQLRDTTVDRRDSAGNVTQIMAYVTYTLHVQEGLRYGLTVVSRSHGRASSSAHGLYAGTFYLETGSPASISTRVNLGENVRAFIVRMYLDYETWNGYAWVQERIEVPRSIANSGEWVYPRPLSAEVGRATFDRSAYAAVIARLRQEEEVRLVRTVFVLTQMDESLYAYYSVVNGFPDSGTLRLDEPDYTNIDGGLGVFATTSESVVVADTSGRGR